ncbi:phage tail tape measure protein [Streptococcus pseudopneumoniae]|uniref:phage tail tape measure protein n=1 Tax=Streptococcus pseudopneumoniae TaxID=257758 RepID=UPI00110B02F6|nr:phage tail tape measure protein [Streptococcus pseudopneumoniae]TMR65338.1 phage tail tape measure protein [Streptococcus pseudopneumoniae]TMR74779.1 phage tail tape measure protein [Streptococcus pseudopneumoniae]
MASGTPLGQMYIELGLDVSKFSPTLTGAKNAVKYFQNNVRSLDSTLKGNEKNASLLQAKYKTLGQTIDSQRKVLDEMKKSFDKLEPGTAKFDKAAADIQRENAKLAVMEGQLRGVEKALQDVGRENSWSGKIDALSEKFAKGGEKLRAMGDAMKPVSAALLAGFTLSTKKAIDFESQMNTTKSLLADTIPTADELNSTTQKLGESSKNWAKQYGISTASINEGMQEIIKKGFDANQTIEAMPAILDAAKASGEDFNTVMNATTNILQQFGLSTQDTERVTNSLTFVANKTAAGFADMGAAMEYVGPVAKNVGMNLEETAAAVGLLSNNGIAGEKAGTALRGALTRLLKPSEQNANAMEKLGFSAEEFRSGAIKLPDILDRIKKNTEGMTDAQKSALIATAFGTEAQTAMNILVDQGGDALRNLANETKGATTYTKDLANELSKSSKNGVERFKSSLEVLQINIGQKLLPLLTPVIDKVNQFIDWLSKAPPAVQSLAVGIGGFLALGYPFLNFLGNGATALSILIKHAGKLEGLLKGGLGLAKVGSEATVLAEGAGAAASSSSLLSGAIGALTNPIGLLVGGAALLAGGLVYLGHKKDEARIKAEEFGSQLSDTARKELRDFQSKVDDTSTAVANFGTHAGDAEKVSEAFRKLHEEVAAGAEKANQRMEELAKKLGFSDEEIAKMKVKNDQVVSNTDAMANQVSEIYKRHNGDASKFSQEEKEIVLNNQREMIKARIEMMELSGEQQKAALQALNGEIGSLNETQLKHTRDVLKKALDEENQLYKTSKDGLKQLLDAKRIDQETYNKKIQELETNHQQTMEALGTKYYQVMQNLDAKVKARTGQSWNYWEEAKKVLEEYGLSYEVIGQKAAEASQKMGDSHSILAKYTSDMSKETREANDAWSLLVGNIDENNNFVIKSNVKEVIGEATKSAEGWEQLQFIVKNANINSNARVTIAEALVESGKWSTMTLEEKQLIVQNQAGLQAIFDSENHLRIWNSMPAEVKQLLLENTDVMNKAEEASKALYNYDALTPKQKELLATDENFRKAVARSTDTLTTWNATTPFTKDLKLDPTNVLNNGQLSIDKIMAWTLSNPENKSLNATDNTSEAVASAKASVNSPKQEKPIDLLAKDQTAGVRNETSAAINAIKQHNPVDILAKNSTSSTVSEVKSVVNSIQDKTVTINAQDNASGVLAGIRTWITRVTGDFFTNVFASRHAHGTNYHPGGLAMVNDQRNSTYKELVTLPDGRSFIPEGRDVLLPLPKGAKVLRADKTKRLMREMGVPKYAAGVGIPSDAKFLREMEEAQAKIVVQTKGDTNSKDSDKVVSEIAILRASMEKILTAILEKPSDTYLDADKISMSVYQRQGAIYAREGM